MMPYNMCTKDHLKAVLSGKKKLLKMRHVSFINVPAFDEIGIKNLYSKVIQMDNMAAYFPDKYPKGAQCDKQYMYNVWNTLHPEDVKQVIDYANRQRFSVEADKVKEETILVTDEWMEELEQMPFISKQKGRMSHLLKQKSKVQAVPKPRIQYDAFDFGKRIRVPVTNLAASQVQPQAHMPPPSKPDSNVKKIVPTIIKTDVDMSAT